MNTEDTEFERIEREQAMRGVPDAIHHTDTSETLEYIQGWNDCRAAMLADQPAQQDDYWDAVGHAHLVYLKRDMRVSLEDAAVRATHKVMAELEQEPALQEIEQYRLQMAAICTAAIGYWKEGDEIHPDYDTLALQDVAALYAKYDELYRSQPAQRTWVGLTDEERNRIWSCYRVSFIAIDHIAAKLKEKNA